MDGVLMFLATLIISLSLGTPRVTFFVDTPAKRKVFNVIYGLTDSGILYAAILPTISPGLTKACSNLCLISPRIQSNASLLSLSC